MVEAHARVKKGAVAGGVVPQPVGDAVHPAQAAIQISAAQGGGGGQHAAVFQLLQHRHLGEELSGGGVPLQRREAAEDEGGAELNVRLVVKPGLVDRFQGVVAYLAEVPGFQGVLRQHQGLAAGAAVLHRLAEDVEILRDEPGDLQQGPRAAVVGVEEADRAEGELRVAADQAGEAAVEVPDRLGGAVDHGPGVVEQHQDPGVADLPQNAAPAVLRQVRRPEIRLHLPQAAVQKALVLPAAHQGLGADVLKRRQGILLVDAVRHVLEHPADQLELGGADGLEILPVQGLQHRRQFPGPVEVVIGGGVVPPAQKPLPRPAEQLLGTAAVLEGLFLEEFPQQLRHLIAPDLRVIREEGVALEQLAQGAGGVGGVEDLNHHLRGKGVQEGEPLQKAAGDRGIGEVEIPLQKLMDAGAAVFPEQAGVSPGHEVDAGDPPAGPPDDPADLLLGDGEAEEGEIGGGLLGLEAQVLLGDDAGQALLAQVGLRQEANLPGQQQNVEVGNPLPRQGAEEVHRLGAFQQVVVVDDQEEGRGDGVVQQQLQDFRGGGPVGGKAQLHQLAAQQRVPPGDLGGEPFPEIGQGAAGAQQGQVNKIQSLVFQIGPDGGGFAKAHGRPHHGQGTAARLVQDLVQPRTGQKDLTHGRYLLS